MCIRDRIIDHHRIGSLETSGPIYFSNQPVGCTATIITQMYDENGVAIRPQIADAVVVDDLQDLSLVEALHGLGGLVVIRCV